MMVSTVMNTNHFQAVAFMLLFLILQFFSESQYKVFLALEVVLNLYMATLLQVARGIKGQMFILLPVFIGKPVGYPQCFVLLLC